MGSFLLIEAATLFAALNSFGADCTSVIQVHEHVRNGKQAFTAKNISSKPIVGYVIAGDERDATGNPTHVFSGVFNDGDSLRLGGAGLPEPFGVSSTGVWHLAKTRMPGAFEKAKREGVDLKADVYPYTYWEATLRVIVTDRDFFNSEKVRRAIADNGGATISQRGQ